MDLHQWMRKTTSMLSIACSHVMFGKVERRYLARWLGHRKVDGIENLLRKGVEPVPFE